MAGACRLRRTELHVRLPAMLTLRPILGALLGTIVKLWVWTWRVRVIGEPPGARPRVFAFWHGQQMGLLGAPRTRPITTLVSWSRDGALQSGVMKRLGLRVIRGSSSRGGMLGLRAIARALRTGSDAAFAVDGPRGPRAVAKPGALAAARLGRAVLVPIAHAARHSYVVGGAWDRFEVPLPFTRVAVVVGPPQQLPATTDGLRALAQQIEYSRKRALALVSQ